MFQWKLGEELNIEKEKKNTNVNIITGYNDEHARICGPVAIGGCRTVV